MIKETEWIFFAGHAKPSSARRALAYRLAEHSRVIIVRQPISLLRNGGRLTKLSDRVSRSDSLPFCTEYTPIHYPERIPLLGSWLKSKGDRRLAAELDRLLAPSDSARRIVCYDSPSHYALIRTLREDVSVYLAIDDRTVTVCGDPIAGELDAEHKLLERVDRVVCVSETLKATLRARATHRTDLQIDVVTNGYDERLFNPQREWEEPTELSAVHRPRILITGHVSDRIDWHGIKAAAALRPAWSWVFVGPADDGAAEQIASIRSETPAKAFLFAPVPYDTVPAWIAHCDVCAVPYRLNSFTLASSPLKAIEYLGAGAAVLSTKIPSLMPFDAVISWVKDGDGKSYAAVLDSLSKQELSGVAARCRRSAVSREDWRYKAQHLSELLSD